MEYKPSLPSHNDNVSHEQPLKEFALLFSGISIALLVTFWLLGFFVDLAVENISPEMEAVIFSGVKPSASATTARQNKQQETLQGILDNLRQCNSLSYPLNVYIVESDKANALALPGGSIVILSGLFDKVQSENGLSFVLAHEIAHFKNRDHLRGLGRGIVLTALAAFISGPGSDLTQILAPSANLGQAHYSQERESLADKQALQTLDCFYGHVGGATEFFESMVPDEEENNDSIQHYFASHPQATERIEALRSLQHDLAFSRGAVSALPEVLLNR